MKIFYELKDNFFSMKSFFFFYVLEEVIFLRLCFLNLEEKLLKTFE